LKKPIKLVVTGTSGVIRRSTCSSARYNARNASELNLSKSSRCVGFVLVGMAAGGVTSSNVPYACDPNALPHAWLSASMVP